MRKWWRRVQWVLLAAVVFMIGFPLLYTSVTAEERPALPNLPMPPAGEYRVYVVDWSYHTAIVIEQPRGWRLGPPGAEGAPFLEFAWGDRRYYYDEDHRPHALFAALFLPTESVLYVAARPDPPRLGAAEGVYLRTVDAATLQTLFVQLEGFARRAGDGTRAAPYAQTSGYRGRFYAAYGKYIWPRDCNWWTVARLHDAGLADAPAGVILTTQVPGRLRRFMRE